MIKYFSLLLIICSCINNKAEQVSKKNIELIDVASSFESNPINVEFFLDTLFMVPLSNKSIIGEIQKIKVIENAIFIFDKQRQRIMTFDFNGSLVSEIEAKGRGPGEYFKIADFDIDEDNKEILIFDQFKRRIIYYSFEGLFIKEEKITPYAKFIAKLGKGNYIAYNPYNNLSEINSNLLRIENNKITSHAFPFDEKVKNIKKLYKDTYFTSSFKNEIDYIGHYDNHVYKIDNDSIICSYLLDFGKYNILKNTQPQTGIKSATEYVQNISNFYESSSYLTFSYVYNKKRKTVYYNKKEKKIINDMRITNPIYRNINRPAVAFYNGYFVNFTSTRVYLNYKLEEFDTPVKKYLESNIKYLKNVDVTSNPIIFFYKLK